MKNRVNIFRSASVTFMLALFISAVLSIGLISCKSSEKGSDRASINTSVNVVITEAEVSQAQQAWGEGIVKIGEVYKSGGDYKAAATEHINNFYNYQEGTVLFKPTLVSQKQFRLDFDGALSYFIAGDSSYPEDHGFAIKPWSSVRWENVETKIVGGVALAMGNYYFTPVAGGDEVKVEYSFAYVKDRDGKLKIILHDSHIPYSPADKH